MRYAITPDGMHEIARRTYRYVRRTLRHVGDYRERIDELVASVAGAGYTTLVLTGSSDLDFLVEYACLRHGLTYERETEEEIHKGDGNNRAIFHLIGERADRSATPGDRHCRDHAWLWEVIGGHGGGSGGDLNA